MPLIKSGSKKAVSTNIREMIRAGHPRDQAVAAALSTAKRYRKKAGGGKVKARQPRDEDIEDRQEEENNRLKDSLYWEPMPSHDYRWNNAPLAETVPDTPLTNQLGGQYIDSADLGIKSQMPGMADGGDVDDPDQQAMMPETFQNPYVKHMVSGAVEQAAVPGQVMTPNPYPPGSEEADYYERQRNEGSVDWAPGQALGMIGGSGAVPARPGELRTGVGIKSQTANTTKLKQFEDLEQQGISPTQNYTRTGWYRDEDGKPRYWIDDSNAQLKPEAFNHFFDKNNNRHITLFDLDDPYFDEANTATEKLGKIWDHPELYEAHPWLANADVVEHEKMPGGARGYYDPLNHTINVTAQPPEEFHNTLHHEVIHAIQHEEGFANGGDYSQFLPKDHNQRIAEANAVFNDVARKTGYPLEKLSDTDIKNLTYRNLKDLNPIEQGLRNTLHDKGLWGDWKGAADKFIQAAKDQRDAYQKYLHLSGESEARTGPYLRENPDARKPYQIPKHINPEIKSPKKVTPSPRIDEYWPGPSSRWGSGAEAELPEGFVPDGVYEPEHRAEGGGVRVASAEQEPRLNSDDISDIITSRPYSTDWNDPDTHRPDLNEIERNYHPPEPKPAEIPRKLQPPTGAEKREPLPSQFYPPTPGDNQQYPKGWNIPADYNLVKRGGLIRRYADAGSVRLPGKSYNTTLDPLNEFAFRQWVKDNNVPFNPDAKTPQDYDMRGFWQGLQQQNPKAQSAIDPNDSRMHYPDYWKTPLHKTFSNESQWAGPNTPGWTDDDKLVAPNGRVVFDDRAKPSEADSILSSGGDNFKAGGMAKKKHTQIDEDPQDHEFINFAKGGLIDSHIPGRTDKIPMRVMPGSYVLPADIPSALGQGNSKAGAEILKKMFTHSAYGLPPPNIHGHAFQFPHMHFPHKARGGKVEAAKVLPANHQLGMKVPKGGSMCANCEYFKAPQSCGNKGFQQWNGEAKLPHPANEYCCDLYEHGKAEKKADGGATETTPIIAAGGEFIIHPDVVKAVGDGDMKKGHAALDRFVINTRKEHISTLKSLKPPK